MTADRQLTLAIKRRAERSALLRLAEVRGWVGGHRAPHREVAFHADDGTRLAATWLPGPSSTAPTVVLVHGFAAHRRKPAYAFLADHLAGHANVLAIDLRGHGQSEGECTLGAEEWRDIAAAVERLRQRGQSGIVVVGLSLGGTATAHALARGIEVDGAVLVSSSARHWDRSLPDMAALEDLMRHPLKRRAWQALASFRLRAPDRISAYADPVDLVAQSTVPLLVVHGADDVYFDTEHARALVRAAGGPSTLWEEPEGFGHAEDGITPAFCRRLGEAIERAVRDGRF